MAEVVFKVSAVTDGDGVKEITRRVREIKGISSVEIDLHTNWVVITGDRLDTEAIRQAVRSAGYDAKL